MGPKNGVRFIKNMMIPTSDGVRLAMDMHFPDSDDWEQTPRSLILEYIPYRKDDTARSTMTIDIRLPVEEGSMVLILLGPFVSMLGVIIIIERPMALGPDPKSTAVWRYIIDISDHTEVEWVGISMAGHRFLWDIAFGKKAINATNSFRDDEITFTQKLLGHSPN